MFNALSGQKKMNGCHNCFSNVDMLKSFWTVPATDYSYSCLSNLDMLKLK